MIDNAQSPKSKAERLALLWDALKDSPLPSSEMEAYERLSQTLNRIEDAHTNAPFDPDGWRDDGRMYPPKTDHRYSTENSSIACYRTLKQNVFIGVNGAMKIVRRKDSKVLFEQTGNDGRRVDQL